MKEKLELVFNTLIDRILGSNFNLLDMNSMIIVLAIAYVGLAIFKLGEKVQDSLKSLSDDLYRFVR